MTTKETTVDADALEHIAKRCRRDLEETIRNVLELKEKRMETNGLAASSLEISLQASIGEKLRALSERCRKRLPQKVWLPILYACGEKLFKACEFETARRFFFDACVRRPIGRDSGHMSTEEVRSVFKISLCYFHATKQQDVDIKYISTVRTLCKALIQIRETMEHIVEADTEFQERHYWLLYNGTLHMYEICSALMQSGFAEQAIPFLNFSILALESVINLSTVRYLDWRVELYCAVCCCYASLGRQNEIWTAANRGLKQIEMLETLESLQPRLSEETKCAFEAARERLNHVTAAFCSSSPGDDEDEKDSESDGKTEIESDRKISDTIDARQRKRRRWCALAEAVGGIGRRSIDRSSLIENSKLLSENQFDPDDVVKNVSVDVGLLLMRSLLKETDSRFENFAQSIRQKLDQYDSDAKTSEEKTAGVSMERSGSKLAMDTYELLCALRSIERFKSLKNDDDELTESEEVKTIDARENIKAYGGVDFPVSALRKLSEVLVRVRRSVGTSDVALVHRAINILWHPFTTILLTYQSQPQILGRSTSPRALLSPDWMRDLMKSMLHSIHVTADAIEMDAPVLRATAALRLSMLLISKGREDWQSAIQVLRSALQNIRACRDDWLNFSIHKPSTMIDAKCLSRAAVAARVIPKLVQSKRDGSGRAENGDIPTGIYGLGSILFDAEQALCNLHVKIVGLLLHAELRLGMQVAELSSSTTYSNYDRKKRQGRSPRRQTTLRALGVADAKTNSSENAVSAVHRPTEQRLLAECGSNVFWKVLLSVRCAEHFDDPRNKRSALTQAVRYIEEADDEIVHLTGHLSTSSMCHDSKSTKAIPRAPLFVSRSSTSATVRIQDYEPARGGDDEKKEGSSSSSISFWIMYGKAIGSSGTSVSMNNTELDGCGVRIPFDRRIITVSNLASNERYTFAVAAYDESGALIGGLGETSEPISTVLPLPRTLLWGRIREVAGKILPDLEIVAATRIFDHFVTTKPSRPLFESNPSSEFYLRRDVIQISSVPELRALIFAIHTLTERDSSRRQHVNLLKSCTDGTPKLVRSTQIALLKTLGKLNVCIDVAVSIDDSALIMDTVRRSFNTMQSLMKLACCRSWILPSLIICFHAGSLVKPAVVTESFSEILSCVCFETLRALRYFSLSDATKAILDTWTKNSQLRDVPERRALFAHLLSLGNARKFAIQSDAALRQLNTSSDDFDFEKALKSMASDSAEHRRLLSFVVWRMLRDDEVVDTTSVDVKNRPKKTFAWLAGYLYDRAAEEKDADSEEGDDDPSLSKSAPVVSSDDCEWFTFQIELVTRIVADQIRRGQQTLRCRAWLDCLPVPSSSWCDTQQLESVVLRVLAQEDSAIDAQRFAHVPVKSAEELEKNADEEAHVEIKTNGVENIDAFLAQCRFREEENARARKQLLALSQLEMMRGLSLYASVAEANAQQIVEDADDGPHICLARLERSKKDISAHVTDAYRSNALEFRDADAESAVTSFCENKGFEMNRDLSFEEFSKRVDASSFNDDEVESASLLKIAYRFRNVTKNDVLAAALEHLSRAAVRARFAYAWQQLRLICRYMWNAVLNAHLSPLVFAETTTSKLSALHFYRASVVVMDMIDAMRDHERKDSRVTDSAEYNKNSAVNGSEHDATKDNVPAADDDRLSVDSRRDDSEEQRSGDVQLVDFEWTSDFLAFTLKSMYAANMFDDVVTLGRRFIDTVPASCYHQSASIIILCQQKRVDTAKAMLQQARDGLERYRAEQIERQRGKRKRRRRQGQGLSEEELAVQKETERLSRLVSAAESVANEKNDELEALQSIRSDLERDENAMLQASNACREKVAKFFALDDDVCADKIESMRKDVVETYEKTIMQLRVKQERSLLVRSLNDLGNFVWSAGLPNSVSTASRYWADGFDAIFSKYDTIEDWRAILSSCKENLIEKYGFFEIVLGACMLSKIARYGKRTHLEARIEHVRCAAELFKAIFECSLSHPSRTCDFDWKSPITMWPSFDPFRDRKHISPSAVLEALHYLAEELLESQFSLDALALSTLMEQIAFRTCRNVRATVRARILRLRSHIALGHFRDALLIFQMLVSGRDLPHSLRSNEAYDMPPETPEFLDNERPDSTANVRVLGDLLDACKDAPLFSESSECLRERFGRDNTLAIRACAVHLIVELGSRISEASPKRVTMLRTAVQLGSTVVSTILRSEEKEEEEDASKKISDSKDADETSVDEVDNINEDGTKVTEDKSDDSDIADDQNEDGQAESDEDARSTVAETTTSSKIDENADGVDNSKTPRTVSSAEDLGVLCRTLLSIAEACEHQCDYDLAHSFVSDAMRWISSESSRAFLELGHMIPDMSTLNGTWKCDMRLGTSFWIKCRTMRCRMLFAQGKFSASAAECRLGLSEAESAREAVWSRMLHLIRLRLMVLDGRIEDAAVAYDERVEYDRKFHLDDTLSARLRMSYADALVEMSSAAKIVDDALKMKLEAMDMCFEAQTCLETRLKRSRWRGFHEIKPSVRANIYAEGADILAEIKLKLARLLFDLNRTNDRISLDASQALVTQGMRALKHSWRHAYSLRSNLLFCAGRLFRRRSRDTSVDRIDADTLVQQFHLRVRRIADAFSRDWTQAFDVENYKIDEDERWVVEETKTIWGEGDLRRNAVLSFLRSAKLNVAYGGHRRDLLRASFLEIALLLGEEDSSALRHRAAFYLACGARVSAMVSRLHNGEFSAGGLDLAVASRALPVVAVQRVLRLLWKDRNIESCNADVLASASFARSLIYCLLALQREASTVGSSDSLESPALCDRLHEALVRSWELYATTCCFDVLPKYDDGDKDGDSADRVCVQWYSRSRGSSSESDTIGVLMLLGPSSSSDENERAELVYRDLSSEKLRAASDLVRTQVALARSPQMRILLNEDKIAAGEDVARSLLTCFRTGHVAADCARVGDLVDTGVLELLSAVLDTDRGINVKNEALSRLMRGVILV